MGRSGGYVADIEARIEETTGDIAAQASAFTSSKRGTEEIVTAIAELDSSLAVQTASIDEAASSVEQMVGNIQSLARG